MVSPNAKNPAPITSAAGASFGLTFATAAEYQKILFNKSRYLGGELTDVARFSAAWWWIGKC